MRQKLHSVKGAFLSCLLAAICVLSVCANGVVASTLAEEYNSGNVPNGLLVSTPSEKEDKLVLTNLTNANTMVGITEAESGGLIRILNNGSRVSVAVSGVAAVYVSDISGEVKKGDPLAPSLIEGVAARATAEYAGRIIGFALNDAEPSDQSEVRDIETGLGKKTVRINSVPVRLATSFGSQEALGQESGISNFIEKLAGKKVSVVKMAIAVMVFTVTLIVSALFLNSSIRGSFVSLGRNPLASKSINQSLLRVSVIAAGIITLGAIVAYVVVVV